jgi:hypothetical protein
MTDPHSLLVYPIPLALSTHAVEAFFADREDEVPNLRFPPHPEFVL